MKRQISGWSRNFGSGWLLATRNLQKPDGTIQSLTLEKFHYFGTYSFNGGLPAAISLRKIVRGSKKLIYN